MRTTASLRFGFMEDPSPETVWQPIEQVTRGSRGWKWFLHHFPHHARSRGHAISHFFSGKLTPLISFHLTCPVAGRTENARPEDRVGDWAHSGKVEVESRVAQSL